MSLKKRNKRQLIVKQQTIVSSWRNTQIFTRLFAWTAAINIYFVIILQ